MLTTEPKKVIRSSSPDYTRKIRQNKLLVISLNLKDSWVAAEVASAE